MEVLTLSIITECPHLETLQMGKVVDPVLSKHLGPVPVSGEGMTSASSTDAEFPPKCEVCASAADSCVCLTCEAVHCSREIEGHAAIHAVESGHCIILALQDMSIWCYGCDGYLDTFRIPELHPLFRKWYRLKFHEEPILPDGSLGSLGDEAGPKSGAGT